MTYYNYLPYHIPPNSNKNVSHSPLTNYNNRYPTYPFKKTNLLGNKIQSNFKTAHPQSFSNTNNIKHNQNSNNSDIINFSPKQEKIPHYSNSNPIFELFGIKLFFDDILLICLIFFLYNEGVKDEYLFIVLILLLLS